VLQLLARSSFDYNKIVTPGNGNGAKSDDPAHFAPTGLPNPKLRASPHAILAIPIDPAIQP
jgi:hypothetical protein